MIDKTQIQIEPDESVLGIKQSGANERAGNPAAKVKAARIGSKVLVLPSSCCDSDRQRYGYLRHLGWVIRFGKRMQNDHQ